MDMATLHLDISAINRALIPTAAKAPVHSAAAAEANTASAARWQDNFTSSHVRTSSSGASTASKPWEWDHSIDATVHHLWQTETSFWGTEETKGWGKEAYLAYKQAHADTYSVDWAALRHDLGISENILSGEQTPFGYEGSFGFGEDHAAANYFAARYVATREQIASHYSGDALADNLAKLDQYFDAAVGHYAESRAALLDSGLSAYGVTEERGKIKASYLALYAGAKENYTQFLAENKNYAKVGGTEYEWLSHNDRFMSASLQSACHPFEDSAKPTSEALYGAKELYTMGIVLDELKRDEKGAAAGSEEAIGMQIGQTALKAMAAASAAGDRLDALMGRLAGGFAARVMDRADQRIRELRTIAETPFQGREWAVDHRAEPFTDRQAVATIVHTILTAFESGNSIFGSLSVGVQAAKTNFSERQKLDLYAAAARYGSDSGGGMDGFLRHYHQVDLSDQTNVNYIRLSQYEQFEVELGIFGARLSGEIPTGNSVGERVNLLV